MKIFHELPIGLMHYAYKWTDGDYCLPHLIDKYEEYRLHFQKAHLNKRFIICDNGLFEGVTHTTEDLIDKIHLIHPNLFLVPDEWNDANKTFANAKYWMNVLKPQLPESTNLMVVMQGKTMDDFISLYNACQDLGYKHFAFNHSSILYDDLFPHQNKLVSQMMGRILLINRLLRNKTIDVNAYHHLLGASTPQEFMYYKGYDFIKSVDTSNPIIVGAQGKRYEDEGLLWKPTEKIEKYMEEDLSSQLENIIFNVQKFRKYATN